MVLCLYDLDYVYAYVGLVKMTQIFKFKLVDLIQVK